MRAGVRAVGCALPEREVTNAELAESNPSWDMARVAERAGVLSRRITGPDETAFDLSVRSCDRLAERGVDLSRIDAILYCTLLPDHMMPGNAHLLHRHLDLADGVLAFDYRLACSGFVYGLAMADSFVRSGLATNVLLVTVETVSKFIHPRDRAVATLFGDAAAATYVSADGDGGDVVATRMCSHGAGFERIYVPAGAARKPSTEETRREATDAHGAVRTQEDMRMDGPGVWAFVNSTIPEHVRGFLVDRDLTLDDIDVFVFHQASQLIIDSLTRALDLDPSRVYFRMSEVGNVSSASIPLALSSALEEGAIQPGDRVLLSAYGAGMSYGSVLLQY